MICFDDFPRKDLRSAACKHGFCLDCWSGYTRTAISSGPAVLDLRCPLPPCKAEVGGVGWWGSSGNSGGLSAGAVAAV
jgi:ariadne-1